MNFETPYTQDQINKIGNTIVYLADKIQPLSKTKLLKLLYLLEETSIKKYGLPFLNIRFDVWQFGPVNRDIYVELTSETVLLSKFLTIKNSSIKPKTKFEDDEFSDADLNLLDLIIESYSQLNASELVKLTHRKHSPWYITAKKHNVLDYFENGLMTTTDIEIDFSEVLNEDQNKRNFYIEHKEYLSQSSALKF